MDVNISEQKFLRLKGKPWCLLKWPFDEPHQSTPDYVNDGNKRGSKEYMENLLPGSMKRLYGVMPALETLAVARCPACTYVCKVQCLPLHFKCDRNDNLVCRDSEIIVNNGELHEKATGPVVEVDWHRSYRSMSEIFDQLKPRTPVALERETKGLSSRSHNSYMEVDKSSHSKSKSSTHSSSSSRDKEKSSKSSSFSKSSSSGSKSKSSHSHRKDKHKSSSGSSSTHSKRRDEKTSGETDGAVSSSKSRSSSSNKDKHERTSSKSRSEKPSSSKDRSEKSSSSKDRSEKSSSSKDRSERSSSSKDKSDKHSSRDRSEKSSSTWSKSSKSNTKLNSSQGSYTLSIPSSDTGQNETVESLLFSNTGIAGPPNQVMKIIATSTGSDKTKGEKTEYEQLKFYADSTDRRSKSSTDTDRHDTSSSNSSANSSFKIPLKSKTTSSSSITSNNDSHGKKGKSFVKPSDISVKSPSKSPSGSVRSSLNDNIRSVAAVVSTKDPDITDASGKSSETKAKLTSISSNGSFKIVVPGKSGTPALNTHDGNKKNRSLSKPLEKVVIKSHHKPSTSIIPSPSEIKIVGTHEPQDLEKQTATKPIVTHIKKKKKKKEKDVPRKIIPLKERSFNPDLHCGVVVSGDSRPCTRSLTCKTHSIALRRAVLARSIPFDALLAAHRKARDEEKNAKSDIGDEKHKSKKTNQNGTEPLPSAPSIEATRDRIARDSLALEKNLTLNFTEQNKSSSLSMPMLGSPDSLSRLPSHKIDLKTDGVSGHTVVPTRAKPTSTQPSRELLSIPGAQIPNSSIALIGRPDLKNNPETKSNWAEHIDESSSQSNNTPSNTTPTNHSIPENGNSDGWSDVVWENSADHDSDVEIISTQQQNTFDESNWRRTMSGPTEKEPRTASELFQFRNRQNARVGFTSAGNNRDRNAQSVKFLTPECTIGHVNWASIYDPKNKNLQDGLAAFARKCGCYTGKDPDPLLFVNELDGVNPGAPLDGESLFELPMDSAENNFCYIVDCANKPRIINKGTHRHRRTTLCQKNPLAKLSETKKDCVRLHHTTKDLTAKSSVFTDLRKLPPISGRNLGSTGDINHAKASRKRPLHPVEDPVPTKRSAIAQTNPLDKRPDPIPVVKHVTKFQDPSTVPQYSVGKHSNQSVDAPLSDKHQNLQTARTTVAERRSSSLNSGAENVVGAPEKKLGFSDPKYGSRDFEPSIHNHRSENGPPGHDGQFLDFLSTFLDSPMDTSELNLRQDEVARILNVSACSVPYHHLMRRIETPQYNRTDVLCTVDDNPDSNDPDDLSKDHFEGENNPVDNSTAGSLPTQSDTKLSASVSKEQYLRPKEGWASSQVFLPDERAQTEVHIATQALAVRTLKSLLEKPIDTIDIYFDSFSNLASDADYQQ